MTPVPFGWRDGLDILLVALVIYRIFTLFRGTRAMQMLVGVGVLVAASLAARQLELHSLGWLLDTLWSFWVVVLVVLFQPELRRALTSIGHAPALRALLGSGGVETLRVTYLQVTQRPYEVVAALAARLGDVAELLRLRQ